MKTDEVSFLDNEFEISIEHPTTIAEFTAATGLTEDQAVAEAVDNIRYRNTYPRIYKKVSETLAKDHSFARAEISTKTLKDGTVRKIHESPMDHIRAALTGRKDEAKNVIPASALPDGKAVLQTLFSTIAPAEPLYVKGERVGSGGKVSEAALKMSNDYFAQGPDRVEKVAEYIEANVPGYKVGRDAENDVTPESLARAISALQKKAQKDADEKTKAMLGAVV